MQTVSKQDTVCNESAHFPVLLLHKVLKHITGKFWHVVSYSISSHEKTFLNKLKLKAMKRQTFSLFLHLGKKELQTLTTVVSERLDTNFNPMHEKVFGSADMWNINRMKRSFVQRRGIM